MGNFCTQCGRPLQDGEVCNCTQQGAAPQPSPAPQPTPQPQPAPAPQPTPRMAPSQSSIEIRNGFNNLLTALKTIWTNPAEAASTLAHADNWLPAILLIAVQALFSGFCALTCFGVGFGLDHNVTFLIGTFFLVFFASLAFSAAAMGIYLLVGKATKGEVTFKSALSTAAIRCFVCLPLTFLGMLLGMASAVIGFLFFFIGEIIAILLSYLAVQETYKLNANRSFLVVGSAYLAIFILYIIAVVIFTNINFSGNYFSYFYNILS